MTRRPWWKSHPKKYWTAEDWAEARRLGVVPPKIDLDPTERLLGQQIQAGGTISWGPDPSQNRDARRRKADFALEKLGLRPRRW